MNRFTFLVTLFIILPGSFAGRAAPADQRAFTIYDALFYRGKPATAGDGLVPANILYENKIWPNGEVSATLPSREAFEALVRSHIAAPGPLVIDVEKLPLKGSPQIARRNMQVLALLADWAHKSAPGEMIGFYGTNTLSRVPPSNLAIARELARHVDAFFPPAYTFDDNRAAWAQRARASVAEARALGPGKPVYLLLWPQYHDGTPKAFQYVQLAYWKFQLETAHGCADGLVLWSPSRFEWNDGSGWWAATVQFARNLRPTPPYH